MLTADLRGILEDSCRVSVTLLSLLHVFRGILIVPQPNDSPNINVCGAMSSSLGTHIADRARLPSSADHRRASAPPGDILDEDLGAPIGLPMNTSFDNAVAGGEDLGTPISRTDSQPPRSNRAAIPSSSWSRDSSRASTVALNSIESMNREDEARPANADAQSFTPLPNLSKSPLEQPSSEDGSKTSATAQTTAKAPSSSRGPADGIKRKAKDSKLASTEQPKKRKKKKDEIDEIFGF
ncbi:hypothetical protein GLOTRDRAFT_120010 [Gloeophyllum trabeum ATCC 11539]|uniref:Uncharacterized protein n=1 Tax=Gloeophyllum trabeum (strain ATCC 11539 / FP-39264 / Madison 617) TaxID=670483 RepID=S7QEC0_GLOTA|nr:uncharacterized protein GLOTRDRAFT_120010 [Gloeophyllum trabeum ATCC 11539]EPQ58161.1 hypothetical protein GLOTRDRAFT_120010 [Gloeophyllum trabeum ATCC 11539]